MATIEITAPDKSGLDPALYARKGDLIVSNRSQTVYRIDKVANVNFQCTDLQGKRWNIRKHGVSFAPAGTLFLEEKAEDAAESHLLGVGVAVQFINGRYANGDRYVVIGGFGPFKVAKLGGDGNRYIRNVLARDLRIVEV